MVHDQSCMLENTWEIKIEICVIHQVVSPDAKQANIMFFYNTLIF